MPGRAMVIDFGVIWISFMIDSISSTVRESSSFCKFDLWFDEFFIGNRPWGKRDEILVAHLLPEMFARERDERGKKPRPDGAERDKIRAA